MSEDVANRLAEGPVPIYEVRLKGHIDPSWSEWFDNLAVLHTQDGETILRGPIADQAALHGILLKIQKLGLSLIALGPVSPQS